MKIKSLLAYSVPLSILFFVVLTVLVSVPPEPRSVKACRQMPGCVSVVASFQGWPSLR
ncbi:hypothetical protein [Pseudomonas huaxiensis]|uniref:hypothetical protein n=1 Tax=Pseudomonas huaxiensis TaxID=2213017 RepID=UPI0015ACB561|nr:hypothetical protein [Pseudomonas huaxiensis]